MISQMSTQDECLELINIESEGTEGSKIIKYKFTKELIKALKCF
jgi:hypothetical protein